MVVSVRTSTYEFCQALVTAYSNNLHYLGENGDSCIDLRIIQEIVSPTHLSDRLEVVR